MGLGLFTFAADCRHQAARHAIWRGDGAKGHWEVGSTLGSLPVSSNGRVARTKSISAGTLTLRPSHKRG